jgi:S-adenosylmethionine:diacylglycerol 3-amino-3-carboxypropyl transferase
MVDRASVSVAGTPWRRGRLDARPGRPKLLFGRMYEDWSIETTVFPPAGRVFTIASAGDTSMALSARDYQVTAVDINPAQVNYMRRRLATGETRLGTADRLFSIGRSLLPFLGLRPSVLRQFLMLDDPAVQIGFWRSKLSTGRFRLGLATVINRVALRLVYQPTLVRMLPRRFDRIIRARLERCFAMHPNRSNPWAWQFFLGRAAPEYEPARANPERIEVIESDAATYLEGCEPQHFIGFSLSNILDGTEPAYGERLMAAVRRSAHPGAVMVLRSFAEPAPGESTEWAARDRSMLWGQLRVERV